MSPKLLLQVRNLSKSYGPKKLLSEASVSIGEKQKIGVIGRNGAGKTTFFKMLLGKEELDTGEILPMPHLRLGYVEQHDPFLEGETVLDFLQRYTQKPEWECAKMAGQFDLKHERLKVPVASLSGGFQMRVKLAATLLFEPNLLLLDEPTNYLDLSTLVLLERFLVSFKGSFMVITHDREFVKKTCSSILDVDQEKLYLHPEPLEEYLAYKAEQKALAQSVNLNIDRKQKQLQTFVSRFGAKASMAKTAQSKLKQIGRLETKKITITNPFSTVKMYIPPVEAKIGNAVEIKHVRVGYPDKVVLGDVSLTIERGKKVAILGDNGQGKSTFLKTLAGLLKPLAGEMKWKEGLKIGYYNQIVTADMNPKETVLGYIKSVSLGSSSEDEIYRVLGNFLFKKDDYLKPLGALSGGEKARLVMAGLFLTKADVYLLDEPTNHLDFETVEALGRALADFPGTVFIVSHDRTFVNLIATEIIEINNGNLSRVIGTYEDYVWQLEEKSQGSETSEIEEKFVDPAKQNPDKEIRKKIFNLQKDLDKTQRKVSNLQNLIQDKIEVEKNQSLLAETEAKWLEISTELESLKG